MTGTLARFLTEKQIATSEDRYWAEVEGDIENEKQRRPSPLTSPRALPPRV